MCARACAQSLSDHLLNTRSNYVRLATSCFFEQISLNEETGEIFCGLIVMNELIAVNRNRTLRFMVPGWMRCERNSRIIAQCECFAFDFQEIWFFLSHLLRFSRKNSGQNESHSS